MIAYTTLARTKDYLMTLIIHLAPSCFPVDSCFYSWRYGSIDQKTKSGFSNDVRALVSHDISSTILEDIYAEQMAAFDLVAATIGIIGWPLYRQPSEKRHCTVPCCSNHSGGFEIGLHSKTYPYLWTLVKHPQAHKPTSPQALQGFCQRD